MRPLTAWIGCILALAALACGGDAPPSASGPPEPARPASASAAAAEGAVSVPASVSVPTSTPDRSPAFAVRRALWPSDLGLDTVPGLEVGRSRALPRDIALYYWASPCAGCDEASDLRRVVFDEEVGALREDRPLAFFDGARTSADYSPVRSFGVSESGQTLAAAVCHAGRCEVETVGRGWFASPDAELRLWVTRDGGRAWEDRGELLPQTRIVRVTDDDVLLRTANIWGNRNSEMWAGLPDRAWDDMLARLAPLGLDARTGWNQRSYWAASREAHVPPPEPARPKGPVDWWRVGARPDGAIVWGGATRGEYLLAIADADGMVRQAHWSSGRPGGSFIADDLLIRPVSPSVSGDGAGRMAAEIVDLTELSIHPVRDLALPFALDGKAGSEGSESYRFITARPAPQATTTRPAVEYRPLALGEPLPLPAGTALYYGAWPKEGYAYHVIRTVFDGSTFAVNRPWDSLEDVGGVTHFRVSNDGLVMAAAVCEHGHCTDCYGEGSEDAVLRLRVSHNGGIDWDDWGDLPQGSYIEAVTADDVAIMSWDEVTQYWWFRSGERIAPPARFDPADASPMLWTSDGGFLWHYSGDAYVTNSGETLLPPGGDAQPQDEWNRWYITEVRGDGARLWALDTEERDYLALRDTDGEAIVAFSWDDASSPDMWVIAFLDDNLLLGQVGKPDRDIHGRLIEPWTTVLIDIANGTVHPVTGLNEDDQACGCLWFVRAEGAGDVATVGHASADARPQSAGG